MSPLSKSILSATKHTLAKAKSIAKMNRENEHPDNLPPNGVVNDAPREAKISWSPDPPPGERRRSSRHSIHSKLTRSLKNRDVDEYYEVLELLGCGAMGTVSKVRRRTPGEGRRSLPTTFEEAGLDRFSVREGSSGSIPDLYPSDYSRAGSTASDSSTMSSMSKETSERRRSGEKLYALKSIHLNKVTDPSSLDQLVNEIDILRSLDHPNIIRCLEKFDHRNQICIVMDLCAGDLSTRDPYTELQAASIVRKILSAISYMHGMGVMHRDIKYENILFENSSADADIKLVDFGLSKEYSRSLPLMNDGAGTLYTMAPEVLKGLYTFKADLWSVGVVAFMLLSSEMPFYGAKRHEIYKKIMKGQYSFDGSRWDTISSESKDLVASLLQKDPDRRPDANTALECKWLSSDTLSSSLHPLPEVDVMTSVRKFSRYSRIKKLALMVVAHTSSTDEIKELRDTFSRYDADSDGMISLAEFKMALTERGYSEQSLENSFNNLDLDGSGFITYTEFIASSLEANGMIAEERLAEAFDRLDADGSGYISKENICNLLEYGLEGKKRSDTMVEEILNEVDTSRDGKISYDEFLQLWGNGDEADIHDSLVSTLTTTSFTSGDRERSELEGSIGAMDQ